MTIKFAVGERQCSHTKPQFGCNGCIDKERTKTLKAFSKDGDNDPLCSRCGQHCFPVIGSRPSMAVIYQCGACPNTESVQVR